MTRTPCSERFWTKVRDGESGCWTWTASLGPGGYGQFCLRRGVLVRAHRWSYEAMVGPIPVGLVLDHLCRNRACVNPDHLDPVPNRVNLLRGTGFAATRAAQTKCRAGHPFDQANTYVKANGSRNCRACKQAADRRSRAKASA